MKSPASPALVSLAALALTACNGTTQTPPQPSVPQAPQPTATSQPAEERPATGPVPQKVLDDCLAALRQQIPNRPMQVIEAKRGEASFIVDVRVEGVPNLWRCYHDGTNVTGTEYQGEG
jgi:hypothetical protein